MTILIKSLHSHYNFNIDPTCVMRLEPLEMNTRMHYRMSDGLNCILDVAGSVSEVQKQINAGQPENLVELPL